MSAGMVVAVPEGVLWVDCALEGSFASCEFWGEWVGEGRGERVGGRGGEGEGAEGGEGGEGGGLSAAAAAAKGEKEVGGDGCGCDC